jgi:hypothetical protein
MPARVRSPLLFALLALMLSPATARDGEFEVFFKNGLRAFIGKRYHEAAVFFSYALDKNPNAVAKPRIVLHGERHVPYVPHYYLGAALFQIGDYKGALEEFRESRDQGVVLRSKSYTASLERLVASFREEVLPEAIDHIEGHLETSEPELESVSAALSSLEPTQREVVTARLEKVRADLASVRSRWQTSAANASTQTAGLDRLNELGDLYRELDDVESLARDVERDLVQVYFEISRVVVATGTVSEPDPEAVRIAEQEREEAAEQAREEARRAEQARQEAAEKAREEARRAEQARQEAAEKAREEARLAEEASKKAREEARRAEQARQETAEKAREETAEKAHEEARLAEEAAEKALDEARRAEKAREEAAERAREEARLAEQAREEAAEKAREEARLAEQAREAAAERARAEARIAAEQREAATALHLPVERALSHFVAGAALTATRNCALIRQEAIPHLEASLEMSSLLESESIDGMPLQPALELARAYMHCGDRALAGRHLEQAREGTSTDGDFAEIEAWLNAPQRSVYRHKYAILIASSNYENWSPIPGPLKDLEALRPVVKQLGFEIIAEIVDPRKNGSPSLESQLIAAGKKLLEPNSLLLFYYAGHGLSTPGRHASSEGWIVPVDAPKDEEVFLTNLSGYSMDTFSTWIQGPLRQPIHQLYIFDSCFSGEAVSSARGQFRDSSRAQAFSHDVTTRGGRVAGTGEAEQRDEIHQVTVVLSAGTAQQRVADESVFRRHLVDVLTGTTTADINADGNVTSSELANYVSELVVTEPGEPGLSQTPVYVTFPEGGRVVFEISSDGVPATAVEPMLSMSEMKLVLEINTWNTLLDRNDVEAYHDFCRKYPEGAGHFRSLARASLKRRGSPVGVCAP